jgi:glutamate-1-semialdehyde 2,1-aminomutase
MGALFGSRPPDREIIENSGVFESGWYLERNADVRVAGIDPIDHFICHGAREGRNPCRHFDTKYYLAANPDVASAGVNPLTHYIRFGSKQGRRPNPYFDPSHYLREHREVAKMGLEPLAHFIAKGEAEGRSTVPDTFCISPFIEAKVMPTGGVQPCCAYQGVVMNNNLPMSVYEHRFEEIWNSDHLRSIRRRMLEGRPIDECGYCFHAESRGEPSMRKDQNQGWSSLVWANPRNETFDFLRMTARSNDFLMPEGPEWIGLDLGNLCNLKCRMCSGTWSSRIAADVVHSRWQRKEVDETARWQARTMVIAPARKLGILYEGLSAIDRDAENPVSWMDGAAVIRLKKPSVDVSAVYVRLVDGAMPSSPVQLFVNGTRIFSGALSNGQLDQSCSAPELSADEPDLVIRIECPTRVAVEVVKLMRANTGKSSVGITRFADGQPWYKNEAFLRGELLYKAGNLAKIHIIGGEPFLAEETVLMMKYLVDQGAAKNILLSFTTNGTVLNEEICELAEKFKSILIGISVDAIGTTIEYIRDGSKWLEIDANIRRFQQIPNATIFFNTTYQAYNMFHVTEVVNYANDRGLGFRYEYLVGPAYLACNAMPQSARIEAAAMMRAFATGDGASAANAALRPDLKETLLRLAAVLDANGRPHDPKLLEEFMLFTNDLDVSRGQCFASINPRLLEHIEASGVAWSAKTRFAKSGDPRPILQVSFS